MKPSPTLIPRLTTPLLRHTPTPTPATIPAAALLYPTYTSPSSTNLGYGVGPGVSKRTSIGQDQPYAHELELYSSRGRGGRNNGHHNGQRHRYRYRDRDGDVVDQGWGDWWVSSRSGASISGQQAQGRPWSKTPISTIQERHIQSIRPQTPTPSPVSKLSIANSKSTALPAPMHAVQQTQSISNRPKGTTSSGRRPPSKTQGTQSKFKGQDRDNEGDDHDHGHGPPPPPTIAWNDYLSMV
ncbi:hypothetical protein IAU59_007015 [Kwoniella sp. CBS 9459]